ncbi:hypothetical protein PENSPDRAFT_582059 [Peniophora sp. CONT]|nr:hypothetical protein PENSPDRAFT_582059 [Peniophora sp. CONT]
MDGPGLSWTKVLTQVEDTLLDLFARCLSLPCRQSLPDVSRELATIKNDDDVRDLEKSALSRSWENDIKASLPEDLRDSSCFPAHRITPSLVSKSASISERESMEFVRQHTTIPVPRTHRADLRSLIMDRIDGENLLSCWGRLSWFRQLRVACTLRLYVKQLRALKRSYPGNIVNGGVSGLFFEYDYSTEKLGPFSSSGALRRYCTYAAYKQWQYRSRFGTNEVEPPPNADFDWSPVFVHGDLNMSNILLDRGGTVWLIDWAWAGYYPVCLEALAMRHSNVNVLPDVVPASWERYRTFIAGPTTGGMEKFWYRVLASMRRL